MDISDLLNGADEGSFDWEFNDGEADPSDEEVNHLETDYCDESTDETPFTPNASARRTGNAYVDGPFRESGLHILRDREDESAYTDRHELGLFSLFFTGDCRDALWGWTNEKLREKAKDLTTAVEFDALLLMTYDYDI
ncbi:unnamed protein product [Phytophthora fragariaefolia]|uniref:Unnamed protein product n=1 Tax=Phytophthora fragariaefolia TaxID=1490495 RepID=A0A9W6U4Z7_9STRA|nr:unnamed protein product [Phytophthora fragariaefolia]